MWNCLDMVEWNTHVTQRNKAGITCEIGWDKDLTCLLCHCCCHYCSHPSCHQHCCCCPHHQSPVKLPPLPLCLFQCCSQPESPSTREGHPLWNCGFCWFCESCTTTMSSSMPSSAPMPMSCLGIFCFPSCLEFCIDCVLPSLQCKAFILNFLPLFLGLFLCSTGILPHLLGLCCSSLLLLKILTCFIEFICC